MDYRCLVCGKTLIKGVDDRLRGSLTSLEATNLNLKTLKASSISYLFRSSSC